MGNRLNMELLAPAGGREQLEYAIRYGADAVYLACDKFGMRRRASNFALEDIPEQVAYCHEHGVKVHVTLNIIMHEEDIAELPEYIRALRDAGVDAFIIGDLGAARLARELAPDVELHVSTQASVSNALTALTWYELGAKRIVCAREMSLAQIASLKRQIPADLELEAFVHGAMCVAYSGRCLISDFLAQRSALDGHCAQSCRWKYTLEEEMRPGEHYPIEEDENGSYIMNAQDLNMLAHLEDMERAGIDSIKIEGRNKKAFYVASVVNAYRNVLDGAPAADFEHDLQIVSHRPYSTGFFYGMAHQSTDAINRTQFTEWAFEVMDSKRSENGENIVTARCRNGFSCESELEAFAPHTAAHPISISSISLLTEDGEVPVEIANRNMELYRFECSEPLEPYTIVRMPKIQ